MGCGGGEEARERGTKICGGGGTRGRWLAGVAWHDMGMLKPGRVGPFCLALSE